MEEVTNKINEEGTNKINEEVTNIEEIAEDDDIEWDEINEEELVALKRSERIKVSRVDCNKGQEKSVRVNDVNEKKKKKCEAI